MFEQIGKVSQQERRNIMRSYILFNFEGQSVNKIYQTGTDQLLQIMKLAEIESLIKSFEYQQAQSYPNIKIHEDIFCQYNSKRKAQFICCHQHCDKNAIICGQQTCKCSQDHKKCIFIAYECFLYQIFSKLSQPISKEAQLYFQAKLAIYEYMIDKISQQREILKEWQQDIFTESQKTLFLYGYNQDQTIICHAPKVLYRQNLSQEHVKCGCFPLKIKKKHLKPRKKQTIQLICKNIQKIYSSMINYIDERIDRIQYYKQCINLSPAEFLFVNFLKNRQNFDVEKFEDQSFNRNKGQIKGNIILGSVIYFARQYRKGQSKTDTFKKFTIQRLRKIWKSRCENLFRLSVEGKAINELFCWVKQVEYLQTYSVNQHLNRIFQDFDQGQQYLFSKSIVKQIKGGQNQLSMRNLMLLKISEYYKQNLTIVQHRKCKALSQHFYADEKLSHNEIKISINFSSVKFDDQNPNNKVYIQMKKSNFKQLWDRQLAEQSQMHCFESDNQQTNACPRINSIKLFKPFSQYNMFPALKVYVNDQTPSKQYFQLGRKSLLLVGHKNLRKKNSINPMISTHSNSSVLNQLQSFHDVEQLSLKRVYVCYKLSQFIKLNTKIKIAALKNCRAKSIQTLQQLLKNSPKLQAFFVENIQFQLNQSRYLLIKQICDFKKLKILSIPGQNELALPLQLEPGQLTQLVYLNLQASQFVTDMLLESIGRNCMKLQFLNVQMTQVSGFGIISLKQLRFLRTLICGKTKVCGFHLVQLSQTCRHISKLSVKCLNLQIDNSKQLTGQDIIKFNFNSCLTHLNNFGCNITFQDIMKLGRLQSVCNFNHLIKRQVKSYFSNLEIKKLNQKGVKVYQGS